MLSMKNAVAVAPSPAELGLLGQQLGLALTAYAAPQGSYWCEAQKAHLTGQEVLGDSSARRRFLVYDSLPGSVHVMAIGVDDKALFIELSPYDPEGVKQAFAEVTMPDGVRVDTEGMWLGRRRLASITRGSRQVELEHGARVLWTVSRSLSPEHIAAAIATFDGLDAAGAYEIEVSGMSAAPAASGPPRMEMRLGLQMELIQKQVPVLAMHTEMRAKMRQGLELQQLFRFEAWLRRDPEDAIVHALSADPSPKGQARVVSFIQFAIARTVKKAAADNGRDIPWSDARKIARKLMSRQPASLP